MFLAYMADARVEGMTMLSEVAIVWDFPDDFPVELPQVPPERQVMFRIDLIP